MIFWKLMSRKFFIKLYIHYNTYYSMINLNLFILGKNKCTKSALIVWNKKIFSIALMIAIIDFQCLYREWMQTSKVKYNGNYHIISVHVLYS